MILLYIVGAFVICIAFVSAVIVAVDGSYKRMVAMVTLMVMCIIAVVMAINAVALQ